MKIKHPVFKFIKFCYHCHKKYFYVVFLKCIVGAGLTVFNAYSLSILLKYLEKNIYQEALYCGGIITLVNFAFYFLNKLVIKLEDVHTNIINEKVQIEISRHLEGISFEHLEDPYYLDLKERAKFALENQRSLERFLTSGSDLIKYILTIIGLLSILSTFDSVLVLVVLIAIALNVICVLLSFKVEMAFYRKLIPINRKYGYYITTLLDEKKGKDYRMYSIGKLLKDKFNGFSDQTVDYFKWLLKRACVVQVTMEVIKYVEIFLIYFLVLIKTIKFGLSISIFSLYISTAISFSQTATAIIDVIIQYIRSVEYINPFVELIEIPLEKDTGKRIPFNNVIENITFENVSFAYPKSDKLILSNISFNIKRGEKISIVGLNGAGKTTLIKLLCRLYKPTTGDIKINGISIYDYELTSYMNKISAVFQDYKLFAYSIKENILGYNGSDEEALEITEKVGLKDKIESLPDGINSLYTKSYDEGGVELSGGEAQKVAIARALYKNAEIVILDEPTSALDPMAEADIYKNFNSLVHDKTAIYISHRMSSSVFCDRILLIDNGRVLNFDTHENLMMDQNSLYYKLFMAQATNYTK